jgi:hypothetical protein
MALKDKSGFCFHVDFAFADKALELHWSLLVLTKVKAHPKGWARFDFVILFCCPAAVVLVRKPQADSFLSYPSRVFAFRTVEEAVYSFWKYS